MVTERLELGLTPHIIVRCNGDLDVRGTPTDETRIEGEEPLSIERMEDGAFIDSVGDCSLRVPEGSTVEIREVLGDCRVKDLTGGLVGRSVNGTCSVRRVGMLHLDEVIGDVRVRDVAEDVQLRAVHGSLSLRDVRKDVRVGEVMGDFLGRDLQGNIEIAEVRGMLALRSSLSPETVSHFTHIHGDAVFRLPPDVSARFVLPLESELVCECGPEPVREGDHRIVTIGGGSATVIVDEAPQVLIKQRSELDEEATFAYTFAIGSQISKHLADISAELETQFATLEADLASTISERVRRQVERRLHNARRQVDAAQRRVEQEFRRAQRYGAHAEARASGGSPGRATAEQERLMILQMLEDGKITVEEAEKLLAAVEGEG